MEFHIDPKENRIDCYPALEVDIETVINFFLDHLMPHNLSRMGNVVLHAGAVATQKGAIAFAGPSGKGKSTLIAAFAKHGYPLLSDDSLLIEHTNKHLIAIPSYPGLRLWDDIIRELFNGNTPLNVSTALYNNKKRININESSLKFCGNALPLKSLFIIDPSPAINHTGDPAISILPLSRNKAFLELMNHTLNRFNNGSRVKIIEEFECISAYSNSAACISFVVSTCSLRARNSHRGYRKMRHLSNKQH